MALVISERVAVARSMVRVLGSRISELTQVKRRRSAMGDPWCGDAM